MEIRFFLTGQDVWNFQKYALARPRVLVPLIALVVIVLSIVFLTTLIGPMSSTNTLFNGLFFVVLLALICLVVVRLRSRLTGGAVRRRLAAQGEHVITISPEGFRHKNNLSDSMISWHALKEIKTDAYNLYFMVDSNITMAHVIPRRAFASPHDADTFLGWAKSYWGHGRGPQQANMPGSATGYERWG